MIKKILITIFIFVFLTVSFTARGAQIQSYEDMIIEEILILGNVRTCEDVIRSQLPFAVGDYWQQKYQEWSINRLSTLNIFSYYPLQVVTQPLDDASLKVIIRIAESSYLYLDPAEFAIMTAMNLAQKRIEPTLYNITGRGQNFSLILDWSDNYLYGVEISTPLRAGKLDFKGENYRRNILGYESEGQLMGLNYLYWWNNNLRSSASFEYHTLELNGQEKSHFIPGIEIYHKGFIYSNTGLRAGLPVNNENSFHKIQSVLYKKGSKNIHGLLRLGYAADNTPVNQQYVIGGFSDLPLRAEKRFLSTGYLLSTFEYHYEFNENMKAIGFFDGGKVWNNEKNNGGGIYYNLGAGMAIETPLGLPVRFDAAVNPDSGDWAFNIGLGFTFSPPM